MIFSGSSCPAYPPFPARAKHCRHSLPLPSPPTPYSAFHLPPPSCSPPFWDFFRTFGPASNSAPLPGFSPPLKLCILVPATSSHHPLPQGSVPPTLFQAIPQYGRALLLFPFFSRVPCKFVCSSISFEFLDSVSLLHFDYPPPVPPQLFWTFSFDPIVISVVLVPHNVLILSISLLLPLFS